jgi:hypothetical protein
MWAGCVMVACCSGWAWPRLRGGAEKCQSIFTYLPGWGWLGSGRPGASGLSLETEKNKLNQYIDVDLQARSGRSVNLL